jgi:hypothetical protein
MLKRKIENEGINEETYKRKKIDEFSQDYYSEYEDEDTKEYEDEDTKEYEDEDTKEYEDEDTKEYEDEDTKDETYKKEKTEIKNILLDELNIIKNRVKDERINVINNNITTLEKIVNGTVYDIPYDIYVKYIVSSPVNFNISKRTYNISQLYDNFIIQDIYKTIQSKVNIDTISNCGIYKIIFNTDKNIATLNKYGENPKMLRFDKNDNLYSINETVLVKFFLPDLFNCKLNTIILNIGLYKDNDKIGHRNIFILKKNNVGDRIICNIYIYEPQGENFKEIDVFEKFINELNEKAKLYSEQIGKNISFHIYYPHKDSCPIGIQELLSKRDTGLCMVYSYLWCYLFIMTSLNDDFIKKDYSISLLVDILEKDIIDSMKHKKDLRISLYKLFVRFGNYNVEGFKKYISKYYNVDENLDKIIPILENYKRK